MSFHELHPHLRGLIGPEADHELLGNALRFCGGTDGRHPGAYGFTGKATAAEHFCQIDGDAYTFCARSSPGGGLTECLVCGTPIFVPPETCLERLQDLDAELIVDVASGDRIAR